MNQVVFALYSGTIQLLAERDLKLTRLSVLLSPHSAQFMKHNKTNTAFLHEIVIIFSPIYLAEATPVIRSFKLMTELMPDAIIIA